MANQNYLPGGHYSIPTISEEYESSGSRRSAGPKDRGSIKYLVTDPNDVQFIEQSQQYPTVTQGRKNVMALEKPATGSMPLTQLGVVNTGFIADEGTQEQETYQTPAAAARAARRSRRKQRQREIESALSPDTSSEDVAPYLNAQDIQQPKKSIIKEQRKERKLVQNGDILEDGNKIFHLKKRGEDGYGFAYKNGKVSVIVPGSVADKAGMLVGDRIVEVNGVNMEGQDKDSILERISRNKKNLILVVQDEGFTQSESSDLNDSGSQSASEFSDSVDRSSGSSVRFQIEGRMNPLKPGESVASLDMLPTRQVVNFDPNPKPRSKNRRHHHSNQRGVYPPPSNGHYHSSGTHHHHNRHQSPSRGTRQGSGRRRSRSRSPAHSSRSRSPATHSSSTSASRQQNGSVRSSSGAENYAYESGEPKVAVVKPTQAATHQSLYRSPDSPVTEQPTTLDQTPPKALNLSGDALDSTKAPVGEEKHSFCCGTYKMWAAFAMIFCIPCIPLGALAFVYAQKSNRAYATNDPVRGEKLGTTAGYFVVAAVLLGLMAWLGIICAVVFSST